jgi:hypothetical protein
VKACILAIDGAAEDPSPWARDDKAKFCSF